MSLRPAHRVRRFVRSIAASEPSAEDTAWAEAHLNEHERRLFARMPAVDRAHSIGVARGVEAHLDRIGLRPGDPDARWLLVAALTHDVGKSVAGLGTSTTILGFVTWVGESGARSTGSHTTLTSA